jgi:hypothetical protein
MLRVVGVTVAMALLMLSGGFTTGGNAKQRPEASRFDDFPVPAAEQFKGKPAAVKLTSAQARRYRTMIREGAREGSNFAGHYTIVQWGCGAGCVQFAVVDAKTGAVFMPPFYVGPRAFVEGQTGEPEEPLQFRVDSRLLIVSGSRNEKGEGVYYYKWDKNRLTLIATAAVKKPQTESAPPTSIALP